MEARHSKSMDSYELLAQFCSKESITCLILPLKEVSWEKLLHIYLKLLTLRKRWFDVTLLVVSANPGFKGIMLICHHQILETSSSLKVCNRVAAVLRRIILGLLVNDGMTSKDILLLCHGLISESLPLLTKRDRYTPTPALTHILHIHCFSSGLCVCMCAETKHQLRHPLTPGCPLPAASSCPLLLREVAGELRSAVEPTCTSWWTLDSRWVGFSHFLDLTRHKR